MTQYVLCYQAGLANVFELKDNKYKRIRQDSYRVCEGIAMGLAIAGFEVTIVHCDKAGDVMDLSGYWESGAGEMFTDSKRFSPAHRAIDEYGNGLRRHDILRREWRRGKR